MAYLQAPNKLSSPTPLHVSLFTLLFFSSCFFVFFFLFFYAKNLEFLPGFIFLSSFLDVCRTRGILDSALLKIIILSTRFSSLSPHPVLFLTQGDTTLTFPLLLYPEGISRPLFLSIFVFDFSLLLCVTSSLSPFA